MKPLAVITMALLLTGFGAGAHGASTELVLAIDGSGSIVTSDWAMMLSGYAAAIANPSIVPQDGSVALGVVQFSSSARVEIPITTITSGNVSALAASIASLSQMGFRTNISEGITVAETLLSDDFTGNQIIDVSTDGCQTEGDLSPLEAAMAAVDSGNADTVNVIGIGQALDCDFDYGVDSFSVDVDDFDGFGVAIADKIAREIDPMVPAPGALLLANLGVGLLYWTQRRRIR